MAKVGRTCLTLHWDTSGEAAAVMTEQEARAAVIAAEEARAEEEELEQVRGS